MFARGAGPYYLSVRYRFEDFEVDRHLYQLLRRGKPVRIDRKVFDLLIHLLEHRDSVVDKQQLLREVWGGEAVVDAVIPTAIARLRKALGEAGPRCIRTVHGRGYRFVSELKTVLPTPAPPLGAEPQQGSGRLDTDLHPRLRDPYVGRQAVEKRLSGALHKVVAGSSRARLLTGEPGIGKTRTALEFAHTVRQAGASFWQGRCMEASRPDVLWPWLQILRQVADTLGDLDKQALPGAVRVQLGGCVPELVDAEPAALVEPTPGLRLYDAVASLLSLLCRAQPRVLLLDDLHWADRASIDLFAYLVEQVRDARLMLVATFRDVELAAGHPHTALLERLERVPGFKRIALEALGRDDVARYVHDFSGREAAPGLAQLIYERTGGNPFFVRETVRALTWDALSDGHLALSQVELPQTARDVVRRRVAAVEGAAPALRAASVVGEHFDIGLLAGVSGEPMSELQNTLDRAERARLIGRVAGVGCYRFAHDVVRETVYDDLPSAERCRLHQAAAQALEARQSPDRRVAELAGHFHRALPHGDGRKALDYSIQAAELAAARADHAQEALWYSRARESLRFVPEAEPQTGAKLMLALGRARRASGQPEAAREALRQALEIGLADDGGRRFAEQAREELRRLG